MAWSQGPQAGKAGKWEEEEVSDFMKEMRQTPPHTLCLGPPVKEQVDKRRDLEALRKILGGGCHSLFFLLLSFNLEFTSTAKYI